MSDADAREVIARDLYDYHPTVTGMMSGIVRDLSWHELVALGDFPEIITQNRLQADAILEALADAGYAVVRKGEQTGPFGLTIVEDESVPNGEIWARRSVDTLDINDVRAMRERLQQHLETQQFFVGGKIRAPNYPDLKD